MTRFPDRLRDARIAVGLTQEQLGFAIGASKSSISAWENGRETPSFHTLPKLRTALGCSLDELICGTGSVGGTPAAQDMERVARDEREYIMLMHYRTMAPRRRRALIDLIGELT